MDYDIVKILANGPMYIEDVLPLDAACEGCNTVVGSGEVVCDTCLAQQRMVGVKMDKYSYNIYECDTGDGGYEGHVIQRNNGHRVFRSQCYPEQESAINACLDWIDNAVADGE